MQTALAMAVTADLSNIAAETWPSNHAAQDFPPTTIERSIDTVNDNVASDGAFSGTDEADDLPDLVGSHAESIVTRPSESKAKKNADGSA